MAERDSDSEVGPPPLWAPAAEMLATARKRKKMSKRGAALAAGFSEITWRQLETGWRAVNQDVRVQVNPRDETLEAAARAVGLDPADVFASVDRPWKGPSSTGSGDQSAALSGKFDRLDPKDRAVVEGLVNRLLGES